MDVNPDLHLPPRWDMGSVRMAVQGVDEAALETSTRRRSSGISATSVMHSRTISSE